MPLAKKEKRLLELSHVMDKFNDKYPRFTKT